ncbi:MAG: DUF58 domain-containing protein [Chitinophagaceae bacterium]|nr:DUF58 domain-containing protein [Chitinophagaceae bacterium]
MSTSDILKRVRQIEIKTKGLSNHIFSGEYHSAFKGRGMSFSEVREYAYGDDVRSLDWNVTARFNAPFVKIFEEERELTLLLMVDISASSLFGSTKTDKRGLITELCAVLSFSAITNGDKVGVIFFSDKVERYIPPKKGKSHILFIIRELLTMKPHRGAQTNIHEALRFLNGIMKKRTILFVLSDFYSGNYKEGLQVAGKKHDVIGMHVYDQLDATMPDVGVIQLQDFETGELVEVNTSSLAFRQQYQKKFEQHVKATKDIFSKSRAELISIATHEDYVKRLQVFFKSRMG